MKRGIWGLVLGVVVLGALAGLAIGGRAETPSDLVITSTAPPTTAPATTTSAPAVTSTEAPDPTTTTVSDASLREATIVVVANAAGRAGLANEAATLLQDAGWLSVQAADAIVTDSVNRAYFAEGFEEAARLAVSDLGLVAVEFTLLPERRLTVDGSTGDLVVLIGESLAP